MFVRASEKMCVRVCPADSGSDISVPSDSGSDTCQCQSKNTTTCASRGLLSHQNPWDKGSSPVGGKRWTFPSQRCRVVWRVRRYPASGIWHRTAWLQVSERCRQSVELVVVRYLHEELFLFDSEFPPSVIHYLYKSEALP